MAHRLSVIAQEGSSSVKLFSFPAACGSAPTRDRTHVSIERQSVLFLKRKANS